MAETKQKTAAELRAWYEKNKRTIENFERSKDALQLLDPTKSYTKTSSTFSKDKLRTYMKNPSSQYKNLRNLSRYLYYRSQVYRRIIHYNANMIDLNYRSVIPIIDLVKGGDQKSVLQSYYDTLMILENMNLPLEFLKVYITCWREDAFFGCAYYDETGFFILPLDPDYCQITAIYPNGLLGFDMNMKYFDQKQEILEYWGEPFNSMYNAYKSSGEQWQPMEDEYVVCLKENIEDWQSILPPYMQIFNALISLADLEDIQAISDEQNIYKLLAITIPLIKGATDSDDWAVDPNTAVDYYNKIADKLPDYTDAIILPGLDFDSVDFSKDTTSADVNRIENAIKNILSNTGGSNVLGGILTSQSSIKASIKNDENYALKSLLPQTENWMNHFLSMKLKNPAKVKFLPITTFSKDEFLTQELQKTNLGFHNRLTLATLSGRTELEELSAAFLEEALDLKSKFIPPATSATTNGSDLINDDQTKSDDQLSDEGAKTKEKEKNAK